MRKNPPIDRDVVASIDILWSCLGWRHSREKWEMDRWKIRTDSARENTIPLLWSRGGECSGKEEVRESFLEEVEFNNEHDFGKRCWDWGVPGIPDREQERQRPGGRLLWGQDRLKRKVPDSGA